MPFARVGAMPQPNSSKQRNSQRHAAGNMSSRPKGITMEDLKKQTALRLANEQQQGRAFSEASSSSLRDGPYLPVLENLHGYPRQTYQQSVSNADNYFYQQHQPDRVGAPVVLSSYQTQPYQLPHQSVNASHNGTNYENFSTTCHSVPYLDTRRMSPRSQRNHPILPQQGSSAYKGQQSPNSRYYQEHVATHNFPSGLQEGAHSSHSYGSAERDNVHQQSGAHLSKQKLPHGLTVHELKEMTKARLQAEAAERHETDVQRESSFENRRVSPLDFESVHEARERALSRDSGCRSNPTRIHHDIASESMNSIPSMVQVNHNTSRDQIRGRGHQASPLPPGFLNYGVGTAVASVSGPFGQQQGMVDLWETASVASHNSTVLSENLGSESAYSVGFGSGVGQFVENESGNPAFTRTRSYSAAQAGSSVFPEDFSNPSPSSASPGHTSSFFDSTIGGNRRRALTLSPKPVSIHEDRPHYSGQNLGIPNMSSTSRGSLRARSRTSYSPVLQHGLDSSLFGQSPRLPNFGADLNRPRTSSAVSLPPITQTMDDFHRDRANSYSGFSATRDISHNEGAQDVFASAFCDNILGYGGAASDFADQKNYDSNIFRDEIVSYNGVTAPPGFLCLEADVNKGSTISNRTAFSRVRSVDSVEAHLTDAWGPPNPADVRTTSLFSTGCVDELVHDMGSILKLSGVVDRSDRERSNTYPHTWNTSDEGLPKDNYIDKSHGSFLY